jgi:hypothetical protein
LFSQSGGYSIKYSDRRKLFFGFFSIIFIKTVKYLITLLFFLALNRVFYRD